jgi:NADH-quinone oxidoreductase subunit N
MLTAVFFMLALVSSNSLLTAYVNIEGLSIMLYVLAGAARSHGSSEAGLKYYGAGAAISAVLMLGLALSYQGAKSFELAAIASVLWNGGESLALVVGLRLVALALFMKLAAVPGHVWAPDVYEGVELSVTAFFATVSKLMVFALVARLVYGCLGMAAGVFREHNTIIMATLAAASIAVGCFGALGQITFKRFIAYAAINQIGFLLIGLAVQSDAGIQRTLHYLVVYMVASLALFAGLFTLEAYGQKANYLSDLSAAFHNGGVGAVLLVFVAVLSMAGLPPFAGFFGKYALWVALIDGLQSASTSGESMALSALMAVSVVTSVFSMYYYLRVLKIAVLDRTGDEASIAAPLSLTLSTSGIVAGSALVVWGFVLFLTLDLSAIGLILDGVLING